MLPALPVGPNGPPTDSELTLMSTTQDHLDPNYIPAEEEVSSGGSDSWRLSQGKICKGRGKPLDVGFAGEIREKFVGRMKAIHLYEIEDDNGRAKEIVSATIQTANGEEIVKVSLSQITAANTFLYGLSVIKENDLIRLTASGGTAKAGQEPPTYANWANVNPMTHAASVIREPRTETPAGAKYDAKGAQSALIEKIKSLPHFKGVPDAIAAKQSAGAGGDHNAFETLSNYAESRGWPRIEVAPNNWLALVKLCQLGDFATLNLVPNSAWASLYATSQQLPAGNMPPALIVIPSDAVTTNPMMAGYDPAKNP